jgi:hypothetical protein
MDHYPSTKGLLFDQPQVISASKNIWETANSNLTGRYELIPGSLLEDATIRNFQSGDCIVMKFVLHDWGDEDCITILSNIRKAIGSKNVQLMLVELIVTEALPISYMLDLNMKVIFNNAKERHLFDWESLLTSSGFKFIRFIR